MQFIVYVEFDDDFKILKVFGDFVFDFEYFMYLCFIIWT